MAFYSYVMFKKNVHVGIEAILHVVREQQSDKRATRPPRRRPPPRRLCLLSNKRLDECNCLLLQRVPVVKRACRSRDERGPSEVPVSRRRR